MVAIHTKSPDWQRFVIIIVMAVPRWGALQKVEHSKRISRNLPYRIVQVDVKCQMFMVVVFLPVKLVSNLSRKLGSCRDKLPCTLCDLTQETDIS